MLASYTHIPCLFHKGQISPEKLYRQQKDRLAPASVLYLQFDHSYFPNFLLRRQCSYLIDVGTTLTVFC